MTLARLVNATADGCFRHRNHPRQRPGAAEPSRATCRRRCSASAGAPYELDLADYFDGKELRFSAVSSTPLVATATLAGSRLTVAPASEGESSVTVDGDQRGGFGRAARSACAWSRIPPSSRLWSRSSRRSAGRS